MKLIIPALKRSYPGNDEFQLETPELIFDEPGYTCVIGANGSGKSSFGEALAQHSRLSDEQNWYFLPQYLERFLFAENIAEQLSELLSQKIDEARLIKLLDQLGFMDPAGMLEFPFLLMSGGERRRIALVCVFYLEPEYLIMDEPDIGVTAKENMVLLTKINNLGAINAGLVVISHSYDFVKGSSGLICLKAGQVQEVGKTSALLADPEFKLKEWGVRFQ
ncbi:MAG: ATP-binding cassette domain-containing protein [Candidatus Marinimicrobia bacterium]|nr:ATP-binding cassette domain-containing protein [Candidatus Neomarinimicrobiota bacterium]